jgi:hypothetical protein
VNLEQVPILRAHVLDGRAVLPLALLAEWLAHGAMHGNPGLTFAGFDNLQVLKGIRLEEDGSHRVRVLAGKGAKQDGGFRVQVEMRGHGDSAREFVHARAEIILADRLDAAVVPPFPPPLAANGNVPTGIYESLLFHGPELQGIEAVESCGPEGILVRARTAPPPAAWIHNPFRTAWLADPLALDCAFQAMIVWCREQIGLPSLPCSVGCYRQYRRPFPRGMVRIAARIARTSGSLVVADFDFLDSANSLIARLEGYECVTDAALVDAFRRNRLAGTALMNT